MTTKQLIDAPPSTDSVSIDTLGYVEAYDAVLNIDYAYVAFKETQRNTGDWCVRVRSSQTPGGTFEQEAMRLQARATGAQGRPYFVWGFSMEGSAADPRTVECRVHVSNGKASSMELFVQMRKFDHSADDAKSVTFAWPS